MEYSEDDFLMLSGIQHFKFCRRRWALIHIENQWAENYRTADGSLLHENAHDKGYRESRGDLLITRGMSIHSRILGVSGECDVLEFTKGSTGVALTGKIGLWQPYPVEYKRGTYDDRSGDKLQLCCQAMCLEEMLCCDIEKGALYYCEPRRRLEVFFDDDLRREVRECLNEMHEFFRRGYTPKVKPTKSCNACSMNEVCLPRLLTRRTVAEYLNESMTESDV